MWEHLHDRRQKQQQPVPTAERPVESSIARRAALARGQVSGALSGVAAPKRKEERRANEHSAASCCLRRGPLRLLGVRSFIHSVDPPLACPLSARPSVRPFVAFLSAQSGPGFVWLPASLYSDAHTATITSGWVAPLYHTIGVLLLLQRGGIVHPWVCRRAATALYLRWRVLQAHRNQPPDLARGHGACPTPAGCASARVSCA